MRTLAILSVSAGAGHVRAAEALRVAAVARGWRAEHIDVMGLVPRLFRRLYVDSYLRLVGRHPALWGYLYHATDRTRRDSRLNQLRRAFEGLNTRKLRGVLSALAPDRIICTHFLPAQLLAQSSKKAAVKSAKNRTAGPPATPTWVVVTDFDAHVLWGHAGLTGYCVAADEIAWRIRERGIGDAQVAVTGIPIMPAFARRNERTTCAAELGVDPQKTTLLMMSGGFGVGAIDELAARVLAIPGDFQLIALAGHNAALLTRLRELATHDRRLTPLGFTGTIERVMACADLAISKPGGLTTSECLALGLPLLVVAPIPGQEERNSDYLLEHGAALKAHDAAGVEFRVRALLADPARLATLGAAAARLGRPDAADRVLDAALA